MNIDEFVIDAYAQEAQLCWQAPREATEVNDYDRRSLMAVAQESRVYARLSRDGLLPLRTPHRSGMTTKVQEAAEALAASRYEAAYKHGPIPRGVTS